MVGVKVLEKQLFAYVDFAEPEAAENAVKKAKEERFHVGNAVLYVSVKKSRSVPKKE